MILGKVSFRLDGRALFGDWFMAEGLIVAIKISVANTATLSIGDYVYMNAGTSIEAWRNVQIGGQCHGTVRVDNRRRPP